MNKFNNNTITELNLYCKKKNIKINNVKITNKYDLINYIIKYTYFNKLKKKYFKIHSCKYIKRIQLEIKEFNNNEYGKMVLNKDLNLILFTKKKDTTIEITTYYPFQSPIINGIIKYEDSNWSPAKKLNDIFTEYINTIMYFNPEYISSEEKELVDNIPTSNCDKLYAQPSEENIKLEIENIKKKIKLKNIIFTKHEDEYYDESYINYKKKICKNEKLGEEKILYHGTDKKSIQSILDNDFSLTTHTLHGTVHGKGIYFTNNIKLACKYSENHSDTKYILLVNVYIGNKVLGKTYPNMLPKIENTNIYYNTAVDNINNPQQFIKKKNHEYNIIGYLQITLEENVLQKRWKRPIKYSNLNPYNYSNLNNNKIKLSKTHIFITINVIFKNRTSEEIFIYEDINKIINDKDILKLNLIKSNDISKFKFIHEIKKGLEFKLSSKNNKLYVCGYYDIDGKFNILNYNKITGISQEVICNIDLLQ